MKIENIVQLWKTPQFPGFVLTCYCKIFHIKDNEAYKWIHPLKCDHTIRSSDTSCEPSASNSQEINITAIFIQSLPEVSILQHLSLNKCEEKNWSEEKILK